ncbi:chymotrypsin [Bombyx mori]|uniref:Peptidase S1 domain-containing protein n=1 Tax=Bombyx mori TaxID=7091 RepID=A0A8R2LU65_BOMMO|nr:chymotrypsin [Bombyx mori]
MDPFIIDGEHVKIERQPHAAFMGTSCLLDGEVSNWRCGASIITQNIVMTAAHCLKCCGNGIIKGILINTGHENKDLGITSSGHKYAIHSGHDSESAVYDIALVLLKTQLKLSANCSRVALMKYPPYDEEAYVSGWGFVNEEKQIATNYLQEAREKIMTRKSCSQILRHTALNGIICSVNNHNGPVAL